MAYTRTPYCYQPNYASSAYSGPSTSLRPSFETTGEFGPPSHCDTNEYFSSSLSRPSNISSTSLPNLDVEGSPRVRPANLERLIREHMKTEEGKRDLDAWLDENQEVCSEYIPESRKYPHEYIQPLITKAATTIKNRCQKSKDAVNTFRTRHDRSPVTFDIDENNTIDETHRKYGVYFLARIDKKLYDVAKSAKKAAGRSGNFLLGKENKTKSERWQDELNKSYRDMMRKQSSEK